MEFLSIRSGSVADVDAVDVSRRFAAVRGASSPRQSYQAWGIAGGAVTSLGVIDARALEVPVDRFEQIAVSLEPEGGSASPTNVLGGVPTS